MGRFGNLEFDDQAQSVRASLSGEAASAAHHLKLAEEAFGHGRLEEALRHFAKVLEFAPREPLAWAGQVRVQIELGEIEQARAWVDKALEQFPNHADLLAAKAVTLARLGDTDAAMQFSDAAVSEQGEAPYVWLARGDVLLHRREKSAVYCFDKAMALAPTGWLVPWLASRIHYFHEQFTLALKYAQEALTREAGRALVWLQLGRCQVALGLDAPAVHSFEQARQIDPESASAREALRELAERGPWERAQSWLRKLFTK